MDYNGVTNGFGNRKGSIYFDIGVIVLISIVPDFYHAISALLFPELLIDYSFDLIYSQLILRSLTVTPAVLYILWLRNENFSNLGLKKIALPVDIYLGIVVFVVTYVSLFFANVIASTLLPEDIMNLGVHKDYSFFKSPENVIQIFVFIIAIVLNSISEEIIARGYLVSKIYDLSNNRWKAIVYSSLLFSSYHIYQGFMAFWSIFIFGCVYGLFFLKYRKLFPLIIAHTIHNLIFMS